jgi:hypothetical protein
MLKNSKTFKEPFSIKDILHIELDVDDNFYCKEDKKLKRMA